MKKLVLFCAVAAAVSFAACTSKPAATEEAVEVVIEAKDNNEELFLGEAADLMYHYLVLLQAKGYRLADVCKVLESRHK